MSDLFIYLLVAPFVLTGLGWLAVVWFERH